MLKIANRDSTSELVAWFKNDNMLTDKNKLPEQTKPLKKFENLCS